ncbi:spore protease YyaC [Paenibacillus sp. 481]|uniref:spore protease YyaC n=1 Tax=Paenibacillus sp. 481 TaxID=2835869 RepID=UPI0022B5CB66|nr:spore protease YyaC [Paenibacillus sp. 481]UHA75376.1 spore protease YyaC [Paenibacillus sp. 481]
MTYPLSNHPSSPSIDSCKIAHNEPSARDLLIRSCMDHLQLRQPHQTLTIVCIGTDRSTGDCLGPLVGTKLARYESTSFSVLGTLQNPVHAMNLQDTIDHLHGRDPDTFIIAIDACLGQSSSIGHIQVHKGPVRPGAGVNKQLPPVGDMHITGIVNVGGFMEYFVLQNTRLHLVMNIADVIADAIYHTLHRAVR